MRGDRDEAIAARDRPGRRPPRPADDRAQPARPDHGRRRASTPPTSSPARSCCSPRTPTPPPAHCAAAVAARTGVNVAVVVTDTAGRAWREGQTDIAIGAAGLVVLEDYAGRDDAHGNELAVTAPAVADELAGAAELAAGKLGRRPVRRRPRPRRPGAARRRARRRRRGPGPARGRRHVRARGPRGGAGRARHPRGRPAAFGAPVATDDAGRDPDRAHRGGRDRTGTATLTLTTDD